VSPPNRCTEDCQVACRLAPAPSSSRELPSRSYSGTAYLAKVAAVLLRPSALIVAFRRAAHRERVIDARARLW
jgi:hypothetical protein